MKALMIADRVVLTDVIDMIAFPEPGRAAVWVCGRPEPLQALPGEVPAIQEYAREVMG